MTKIKDDAVIGLNIEVPQYLDNLKPPTKTYGELYRENGRWVIKGEPQLMEMIRRIFSATARQAEGYAELPITNRVNSELNWLMMRYPLQIKSDTWSEEKKKAVEHYKKRVAVNIFKPKYETPINFKGKLAEYQKEGLAFLWHNKRCLLADEMGLGKTPQSLAFIAKNQRFPVIIVTPPHLMYQWEDEIEKFLGDDVRVHKLRGVKNTYNPPEADIYLTHYLILRGWKHWFDEMWFDTAIFDEIQELRHTNTAKYGAATIISKRADNIFGLSGTPIYNYGNEMYHVMNIIDKGCLGEYVYFIKEWCREGWQSRVIENPEAFGEHLREEGLLLRRRKDDVLSELPPKRRAIHQMDVNQELYINHIQKSVDAAKRIPLAKDKEKSSLMLDAIRNARRAAGIAKAQHVAKFVEFLLKAGEPCLLYAYHHDVIDLYIKYLEPVVDEPLRITGKETQAKKNKNIQAFMRGWTNLLIINLRSTAGLNLQRARCVVFGELDWSPAIHSQAEDRAHRIGQKDSVLAYYLVSNELPSDSSIMKCLGLKEDQFRNIMQDAEPSADEQEFSQTEAMKYMWEIIDKLQEPQPRINKTSPRVRTLIEDVDVDK